MVMTGIEDVEVQREDGEEEEKPTEGNGKLMIGCITLVLSETLSLRKP